MKKSMVNLTIGTIALTGIVAYVVIRKLKAKETKKVVPTQRKYTKIAEFVSKTDSEGEKVKAKAI